MQEVHAGPPTFQRTAISDGAESSVRNVEGPDAATRANSFRLVLLPAADMTQVTPHRIHSDGVGV
jgi:hypothetical protein